MMLLRGTPNLATASLCFICLLGLKLQSTATPCSIDVPGQVEYLIGKASETELDCRLYTPTISDYEQNCPNTTLTCFAEELKMLIKEWRSVSTFPKPPLVSGLKSLSSQFNKTESRCRCCECHKEENATAFLKRLLSTLEVMNSQNC
ncbi:interleukin 15, like isoform 2-T2 [Aulostomus maculatus]